MNETEISRIIMEAATEMHDTMRELRPDEFSYRSLLTHQLTERGLTVEKRVLPAGKYEGVTTNQPTLLEMVVEGRVLVECIDKAYTPRHEAQALAKLRIAGLRLALVIPFKEAKIRQAIRRVMNVGDS